MVLLNLEKVRRNVSFELRLIKLNFEMHVKPGGHFSLILIFFVEGFLSGKTCGLFKTPF